MIESAVETIVGWVDRGSVTKPQNIVGENLIRRSYKRKNVEQTVADAILCKQSETRHRD